MVELLSLRQEHARLLGYASFAEVSLVPKMADRPSEVLDFLRDLGRRARPYAERDVREVREFAASTNSVSRTCSHGTSRTRARSCARRATRTRSRS